ncbi:MAG: PqqD family protein [bacterium]
MAEKKLKGREDVVFTDLDDGSAVLLHLESKYYYSLNDTGSFLWKLMEKQEGTTEQEMIKELCDAYDVDEGKANEDASSPLRAPSSDEESGAHPANNRVHATSISPVHLPGAPLIPRRKKAP